MLPLNRQRCYDRLALGAVRLPRVEAAALIVENLTRLFASTGFPHLTAGQAGMLAISCILMYLAIFKEYEPLLLLPIGFGCLLANLPLTGLMDQGGLLKTLTWGLENDLYPALVFIGVGAMIDFGPLLANPSLMLLGAAGQIGIFTTFLITLGLGFTLKEAGAIGIIGAADGPTAIFMTQKMAPHLLGPVAVAAYSYMSLVPIIQRPIMRLLTTEKERQVVMRQWREVSRIERIVFPIAVTVITALFVPTAVPLTGTLMLGNLVREAGVVERLSRTLQEGFANIVSAFLGISVGATMQAEVFLTGQTLSILALGLVAFIGGSACGVLMGKVMYRVTGGRVNPLIGSAGISAMPMAARVSHAMGREANPQNFLIMHAMAANVAGQLASPIAAAVLFSLIMGR
jgi:sodium ion-translocating decarboxylase beta subunit